MGTIINGTLAEIKSAVGIVIPIDANGDVIDFNNNYAAIGAASYYITPDPPDVVVVPYGVNMLVAQSIVITNTLQLDGRLISIL